MNGSLAESEQLVAAIKAGVAQGIDADVLLCPPFVYLSQVAEWLAGSDIALGGQNLADQTRPGAFTGEIAGHMLKDVGCAYVIVGHSERRTLYGEDNATVARKFSAAQEQDLTPILCVGETLEQRERGETHAVVEGQIQAVLDGAGVGAFANAVVAYEPVWAIGTGLTATPGQAQAVHAMIRAKITALDDTIGTRLTVLYGGSVNASNASELLAMDDIDGGLVGGASLKAAEFIAICQAA
jgi:triosephosphate isomerase